MEDKIENVYKGNEVTNNNIPATNSTLPANDNKQKKGTKQKKEKGQFKSAQDKYESDFVKEKLKDFEPKASRAWISLTSRYGPKINQNQLLSLAEVVSYQLNLGLFREYKRRKEMLIKWFDENYDAVWPFIENHITVIDINGSQI